MKKPFLPIVLLVLFFICILSCSDSSDAIPEDTTTATNTETDPATCNEPTNFIFSEQEGLLLVEFENTAFETEWELIEELSNATGNGYMLWSGTNSFSAPGNGLASFKLKITNPGTYRFIWRSSVKEGTNGTESNDSWLRFPDVNDFYGKKGNGSIVYPAGLGKTPIPNGASSEGWFKIYRSGNDLDFKWQSSTSDNDAHQIYVVFSAPGIYNMEVSGRSFGHAIDKFILFKETQYTQNQATGETTFSDITCD